MAGADVSRVRGTWGNIYVAELTSGEGEWIEYA
jgi:hypothetical protein